MFTDRGHMETGALLGAGRALSPTAVVWLLGLTQIIGYGTVYYSFAILAGGIAQDLGWPVSWLFASLSIGMLAGGLIAPEVGRRMDRHGAAVVMAIGSLLFAVVLSGTALAPTGLLFALGYICVQAVSPLALYDAAFATLVQTCGADARKRITHLTLIAGFASTLFWPLTSWLESLFGWREIYLGFALANLVICFPIHAILALQQRRGRPKGAARQTENTPAARLSGEKRLLLWLVTLGFALSGFALSAILAQLVPVLVALGLGTSALLVATLFGPAQVAIRFINMAFGAVRHPIWATIVASLMVPLALGLLAATAPVVAGAVAFALLLGFGSGLKSIVQGTLPLALFGSKSYGARLGVMAAFRQVLAAVAPFLLALSIEGIGVGLSLWLVVLVGMLGLACMIVVARVALRPGPTSDNP
ncbi:arsenite efflux MFS transporter ArsK [Pelagibacterium limicola]|uniref:arsenite efflux MFS transporter ArsK n=1 Tax=Pelagibacterium limicola TaxID=2791022 RepID=UPI0018B009D2|nr:arsenite efflux MFS transporter ArsK [Pelagibacterium limicola]